MSTHHGNPHAHGHDNGHHHSHGKIEALENITKAFIIGICINTFFIVFEFFYGWKVNSLALISDASHNLSDTMTLLLSLVSFFLLKVKANEKFTYGYKKSTILASFINTFLLVGLIGIILWESINKFFHPLPVQGGIVAIVATIGIAVNGFTAYLFRESKESDINVKSAYLHFVADAVLSLGVVISGILIYYTGLVWIDALTSILVVGVIAYNTWDLVIDTLRMSLDGVPRNINRKNLEEVFGSIDGVEGFHHIHIWPISSRENSFTAHVVLKKGLSRERECTIKDSIKHTLEDFSIQHSTLEFEYPGEHCHDI